LFFKHLLSFSWETISVIEIYKKVPNVRLMSTALTMGGLSWATRMPTTVPSGPEIRNKVIARLAVAFFHWARWNDNPKLNATTTLCEHTAINISESPWTEDCTPIDMPSNTLCRSSPIVSINVDALLFELFGDNPN